MRALKLTLCVSVLSFVISLQIGCQTKPEKPDTLTQVMNAGMQMMAMQAALKHPDDDVSAEKLKELEDASPYFAVLLPLIAQANDESTQLGNQVIAVQEAINHPEDSKSMEAIIQLGTDSRYYVMVRGWLVQEVQGAESQRDARQHESSDNLVELDAKIAFLKKAIRRIDLE